MQAKHSNNNIIIINITFTSSKLEGMHRRQNQYEVLTHSQENLEAKGDIEQPIWNK